MCLLLIDVDQDASTGWLGYDLLVNHDVDDIARTPIKRWTNGAWETFSTASYAVNGNGMEVQLSRDAVAAEGDSVEFDFHWADNIQGFTDVSELGVNGDSAPNRRWNYRY